MNNKELKTLTLEDLKRSGLTLADFKKMGLVPCDEEKASMLLNSDFCTFGYALPYFDVNGNITENVRFRFLEDLEGKNDKVVKYSQPKGTEPRLYFPPCLDWVKICNDPSITITFTEGEKKAYKASKEGIPTIGLGGVWSFKSKKLRKDLIDDFKSIVMNNRKINICYDNDIRSNEEVSNALHAFAKALGNVGANAINKLLPFNPYQKIGLDDYLLDHSLEDFNKLPEETFSGLDELISLNNKVSYIESVGKFYVFNSDIFVGSSQLKNDTFAHHLIETGQQPLSAAGEWLKWNQRRTHSRLTYKPAQPLVTEDNELNLWKGWGALPEKGNIKPFLKAVNKIFNNDKKLIQWFLDWVAYPIQNPATKMLTAVLLQSVHQGTGKSSLGLAVGAMYGDNFRVITDKQLHAPFNEWAINKQFILGDEVSGKDKRSDSDFIKNLITQETISINKKYSPSYDIPDCMNYLLTSNHVDAWYLEPDDRRAFVHDIKKENGLSLTEGIALENFRKGKGKAHLLHYFINEHKISKGFDHRSRPPMTMAKETMIDMSRTDVERFINDVKLSPDSTLQTLSGIKIVGDLFTTSYIIKIYENLHPKEIVTGTAIGKALVRILTNSETYVVGTLQGSKRLRPLRNIEKWNKATHQERQEHYDATRINNVKKKVSKLA